MLLTVLTVFSRVARILMILLPARPSRLNVMSMPMPAGTSARDVGGQLGRGDSWASRDCPSKCRHRCDWRRHGKGRRCPLILPCTLRPAGRSSVREDCPERRLWRAYRTRRRSICASAILRASSWISRLASGPAISRASASTSSENLGYDRIGILSPCRRAFLAERALPPAVFGPVQRAFGEFDFILRALLTAHFA
jgi:hypothetical protein